MKNANNCQCILIELMRYKELHHMPPFTTLTTLMIPISVIASLPIDMSSPNSTEHLPSWPWVSTPPWVACKRERNTRLLHVNLWEKPAQFSWFLPYPKGVARREWNNGTQAGDEAGETKTPSTLHFDASHSPQLHHDVCFNQVVFSFLAVWYSER